ncbi:DUF2939 domain-containing protein [Burkholderia sp. Bp9090]|uniref:DUF2939 domain-containing protein n=1 Tax=Burkholderia sp. Bp9090 TaxID=2184567 RepID=UPI000F5E39EB|nr:DUF2939 domain-containing protein [Burkholderia sp. Bp9090]RQZ27473.1 DUF2939 domain-containing protein [Burkholderia sp. Bp9090]
MKKKALIAGVIVIAIGGVTSYASPYITMHQMRSAMVDKNADAFSSHVDFPSLRESLRAQFAALMQVKMTNSADMKDNPFAGLGMMMAMGFANQLIDTMVTPSGVMTMMAQGSAKPVHPDVPPSSAGKSEEGQANANGEVTPHASNDSPQVDYSVGYKDWSTVTATARKGTEDQVTFVFKRDGLWSWKLAGINLPVDKLSAN